MQDGRDSTEMLVTEDERDRIEEERQRSDRLARIKRIVEDVYDQVRHGEVVVEEEDSVHGNVGYLSVSVSDGDISAAFDPTDTGTERQSLEWSLETDDEQIISDLVSVLPVAALHRRLVGLAYEAVEECTGRLDPDQWSEPLSRDELAAALIRAVDKVVKKREVQATRAE